MHDFRDALETVETYIKEYDDANYLNKYASQRKSFEAAAFALRAMIKLQGEVSFELKCKIADICLEHVCGYDHDRYIDCPENVLSSIITETLKEVEQEDGMGFTWIDIYSCNRS